MRTVLDCAVTEMGRSGTLIYNITRKFTCMGVNAAGMVSGCSSVGLFGFRKCLLQMYVHLLTSSWVNVALPQTRAHFLHFSKSLCGFGNGIHVTPCMWSFFFVSTFTITKPVTTMACSSAFLIWYCFPYSLFCPPFLSLYYFSWHQTTVVLPICSIETCMHIINLCRSITIQTNLVSKKTFRERQNKLL